MTGRLRALASQGWLGPFTVGLAIRLGFLGALTASNAGEAWDAMGYHERGLGFWQSLTDLAQGHWPSFEHIDRAYSSYYPPFQMMVLAAGIGLFGESLFASRLTMVLLGAATIPLVHAVTHRRFGSRAAFWAAGIAAVYPAFVYHAVGTRSETTYIFLLFAGVWLLDRLVDRLGTGETWRALSWTAGVVTGLTLLTRTVGLPLAVLLPLWLAWAGSRSAAAVQHGQRAQQTRHARRAALAVAAGALLTVLPWEITVSFVEQRPVLLSIGNTHDVGAGTPIDRERRQTEIAAWLRGKTGAGSVGERSPVTPGVSRDGPSEARTPHGHPRGAADRQPPLLDLQSPLPELERGLDAIPWSLGPSAWRADPIGTLGHGFQHLWLLIGIDLLMARQFLAGVFAPMSPGPVAAMLGIALAAQLALFALLAIGVRGRARNPGNLLLLGIVVAALGVHFFFGREAKYAVPLHAILLPFAGHGLARLVSSTDRRTLRWPLTIGIICVLWISALTATRTSFASEVRAASSWYAPWVAGLGGWIADPLPVSDRFLVRRIGAGSTAPPSEAGDPIVLRIVGDGYRFVGSEDTVHYDPRTLPIRSFVTLGVDAIAPVRVALEGAVTTAHLEPRPDAWQVWIPVPELGIEWMWIGGPYLPVYDVGVLALTGERADLVPDGSSAL